MPPSLGSKSSIVGDSLKDAEGKVADLLSTETELSLTIAERWGHFMSADSAVTISGTAIV